MGPITPTLSQATRPRTGSSQPSSVSEMHALTCWQCRRHLKQMLRQLPERMKTRSLSAMPAAAAQDLQAVRSQRKKTAEHSMTHAYLSIIAKPSLECFNKWSFFSANLGPGRLSARERYFV